MARKLNKKDRKEIRPNKNKVDHWKKIISQHKRRKVLQQWLGVVINTKKYDNKLHQKAKKLNQQKNKLDQQNKINWTSTRKMLI